jgi:hypothetical protein
VCVCGSIKRFSHHLTAVLLFTHADTQPSLVVQARSEWSVAKERLEKDKEAAEVAVTELRAANTKLHNQLNAAAMDVSHIHTIALYCVDHVDIYCIAKEKDTEAAEVAVTELCAANTQLHNQLNAAAMNVSATCSCKSLPC